MSLVSWRELEFLLKSNRRSLKNLANKAPRFYEPFDIAKKTGGGLRHIDNPIGLLKETQRRIYRKLLRDLKFPTNMVGGIAGCSVRQNALAHVNHPTLVKMDLRNHFGRITNRQVFDSLRNELELSPEIARIVTQLTTIHSRLPQGAPTSTILANLVILPAHRAISSLADRHNITYTLFVDDLTFSGPRARQIIQEAIKILQKYGFAVSSKKLRILDRHDRQETTGIVVNNKVSVSRTDREQIRLKILSFKNKKAIPLSIFSSLWGSIRYISFIHASHGQALARLAEETLPTPIDDTNIASDEQKYSCLNSSTHRYRPL